MTDSPQPASPRRPRPTKAVRRTRRVWRVRIKRVLTGVALGLAILLGLTTLLTKTPLCKLWLLPAVSNAMGLEVTARSATVLSSGTVVMEDAVFRIPGLDGPAGRLMEVARLEVDPDFLRPGIPIARMRLDGAVLRVSQATDADSVNVQMWNLPGDGPSTGGPRPMPPRIDLRSATIELGEHGPGTGPDSYRVLKSMVVRGQVVPTGHSDGAWAIDLHEADPADPTRALRGGIAVAGRIDDAGVHLSMTQASLADWPASAVPTRHRHVFEMLAIDGEITRTFLELPWEGEVAAGINLRNVSMTLPFEPRPEVIEFAESRGMRPPAPEHEHGIRLTRSGGTIAFIGSGLRANLDGWIEDLPYSVSLDYQGLDANSPFRCEMTTRDYHLSEKPSLVPFLPKDVFERLADFRNPTGLLDAQAVIERGPPVGDEPGKTSFSGRITVRDGRAAFNAFPYPFENMQAEVSFNEDEVLIERITGVSPSGALLSASGRVSPLGDLAEVTIRVTVTGGPVDARMLEALGPKQAPIIDAIFSHPRMAELEAAGLVISSASRDAALAARDACQRRLAELSTTPGPEARAEARSVRAELADLDRRLRAPEFSLGGLADVTVVVHRLPQEVETWENTVEIQLARAGVLPAHFPYPIEATGVRFIIKDRNLTMERGQMRPLSGGSATVSISALVPGDDPGEEGFAPNIAIQARDVPVDRLLLHAAGHAGDPAEAQASDQPGVVAAARENWLAPMQAADLVGTIDADINVLNRASGQIGFDVAASFAAIRAAPPSKADLPGTIFCQASSGSLLASEERISFAFTADVITREAPGAVSFNAGRFEITTNAALQPDQDGRRPYTVIARGRDVLTDQPIERIVGLVSPEGEVALADLRARYSPSGQVHGIVEVAGALGEPSPRLAVDVHELRDLSIALEPGRVGLATAAGGLRIALPGPGWSGSLTASDFEGDVTLNGQPWGRIGMAGTAELLPLPVVNAGEASAEAVPADPPTAGLRTGALDMRLSMLGAALESPLTRAAIQAFVPDRGEDLLALDPAGQFDANLAIRRDGETAPAAFEGEFRPRSLAATLDGERLVFHDVQGLVRFNARGGQAEGIRAAGPDWTIAGDAAWTRSPDGQIVLDATASADAASLTPRVRAILPAALNKALEDIALTADGPLSLTEGVLHASIPAPVENGSRPEPSFRASGAVAATRVSATVGLPIVEARGTAWFDVDARPGRPAAYTLSLVGDSLRAAGLRLDGARARISSGEREGEVLVPTISAGIYGGRLAGSGRMTRAGRGSEDLKYDLVLQMSGVRLASLLADREEQARLAARPGAPQRPSVSEFEAADASRGLLAAEVSLGGVVGRDATRRGRGSIQIGGGPVVSLPLLMPVIEVANLQLPASTPLDVAFAEFFVLGDTVTFEELSAFTRTVEIWGYGTLAWTQQDLDLRVNTRSTSPIPVVSELFEGVRNELVSTRVRGTLAEPDIDTIQFQGTRRVLDTLLGDGPDEQQRRLSEIGDRARLNRTRALRAGERLRWLVASQMESQQPREDDQ